MFFEDFQSEYLMVDSCGLVVKPPPHGPPKDWPPCPACGPRVAQARWEMTKWRNLIDAAVAKAEAAGAVVVKRPQKVFWGGYSSYIKDPDGHLWELAFNPFMELDGDGRPTGY